MQLKLEAIDGTDREFIDLLVAAALPTSDLAEEGRSFFGARDAEGHLVCAGGLEWHAPDAILRSCVVRSDQRGRSLGSDLVQALCEKAGEAHVRGLYLLTETAEQFFLDRGFEPVDRTAVPRGIAQSRQFADLCPASAAALAWSGETSPPP